MDVGNYDTKKKTNRRRKIIMSDKEIKVTGYTKGNGAKIDIYEPDSRTEPHNSIHIKINTETGSGQIIEKDKEESRTTTDTQCYLTTACMRHHVKNFNDNCYELTLLRWFRDSFVRKEDVDYYYEIAPTIVENINKTADCEKIYNSIYEKVIIPCIKAIEAQDYNSTYEIYKHSFLILEEEFINPKAEQTKGKGLVKSCF